ncbi:MAG: hypothetical protein K9K67_02395 [Bacteriovoracaceae bacterium]|nr:hypothetical protein [Bacteriovoracaceae bacterium]
MLAVLSTLKAIHFLVLLFFLLCFSLWIREEFITIFNRKKIASLAILKVLLLRLFGENNGFFIQEERGKFLSILLYVGTILSAILPLFFVQLSDRFDLFGNEIFLGLITNENSWLFFFGILIISEILRSLYDQSYKKIYYKIPLLLGILLTFVVYAPSFSIEQMVQYQKSFNEFGLRNYFLLKNPLGVILILNLLYTEIENPRSSFNLLNHLFFNTYIIMFIYGFLGGYGLPSILEKQNFSPGLETVILQNISLIAKFIFCIIIIWVFKFSLIKTKRVISLND